MSKIDLKNGSLLFWSIVIHDTDTRCLIDNRKSAAGGKATVGSKTPGMSKNEDSSYYIKAVAVK
jgi:hypothetical protein